MNWDQLKGRWTEMKGEAHRQWSKLNDDDLGQIDGDREKLSGRIQQRYGVAKEEADRQADDWINRIG